MKDTSTDSIQIGGIPRSERTQDGPTLVDVATAPPTAVYEAAVILIAHPEKPLPSGGSSRRAVSSCDDRTS